MWKPEAGGAELEGGEPGDDSRAASRVTISSSPSCQAATGSSVIGAMRCIGWLAIARSANSRRSAAESMNRCAAVARRENRIRRGNQISAANRIGNPAVTSPSTRASWPTAWAWSRPASAIRVAASAALSSGIRSRPPTAGTSEAGSASPRRSPDNPSPASAILRPGAPSALVTRYTSRPSVVQKSAQQTSIRSPVNCTRRCLGRSE